MTVKNNDKKLTKELKSNTGSVLIYAFSMIVALGINDLISTIFDRFSNRNKIMSKVIYVIIVFVITLLIALWTSKSVET